MSNTTNNNAEVFNQLFETFASAITKRVLEQVDDKISTVFDNIDVDDRVSDAIDEADIDSRVDDAINEKDMSELVDIDEVIYQVERKMDLDSLVTQAIENNIDAIIQTRINEALSKLKFNVTVTANSTETAS